VPRLPSDGKNSQPEAEQYRSGEGRSMLTIPKSSSSTPTHKAHTITS